MFKRVRLNRRDLAFISLIFLSIAVYFAPFFYPETKLLITPDFARSDSWHSGIPAKYLLWDALRQGTIPLWTDKLGSGYPLFADGLAGVLYLPHIIIFSLLPFAASYSVNMVFTVFVMSTGVYTLLRKLGTHSLAAFFAGITVSLSGIVIPQLTHMMLLPSFSLMPWVLAGFVHLSEKPTLTRVAFVSLPASQQVLAGFPQAYFITWMTGLVLYAFLTRGKPYWRRGAVMFATAGILTLGASAVQLLPSVEYLSQSQAAGGFGQSSASFFSYPPQHLVTLIDPFLLGNPKFGTYPDFQSFSGSIFWENTAYIGILPLILAVFSLVQVAGTRTRRLTLFFLVLAGGAYLLMLGQYSPLYIVYSMWPFNLFRVPSRFIYVFVLSLVAASAFTLERIVTESQSRRVKILAYAAIALHVVLLHTVWNGYHLLAPASQFLDEPPLTAGLDKNPLIITAGSEVFHNSYFLEHGWQDPAVYLAERNLMAANANALWGRPQFGVYQGRQVRKISVPESLLSQEVRFAGADASVSATGVRLMRLFSIEYILSTGIVRGPGLSHERETRDPTGTKYAYRVENSNPQAYFATVPQTAETVREAIDIIRGDEFNPESDVLMDPSAVPIEPPSGHATVSAVTKRQNAISADVEVAGSTKLLVINMTNYPGWTAKIDGADTEIYGANLRSMAIPVPEGVHRVDLTFDPGSFRTGAAISALFYTVIALLAVIRPGRIHARTEP